MKGRTGTTQFKQVFSHLEDNDSTKNSEKKQIHHTRMIDTYGEERAARLIEGNTGADHQASLARFLSKVNAPNITPWHPDFVIKSTRKNATERGKTKGYITEKHRDHIKQHIRDQYKYDHVKKNKDRYDPWLDNPNTSPHSWELIKTLKPE